MQHKHVGEDYGLNPRQIQKLVVDSNLSPERVLRDAVVPVSKWERHAEVKPYLCVVSVIYRGFDNRIHQGQIVVHEKLVDDTNKAFIGMFKARSPIKSVIPMSEFNYDNEWSMRLNNSSNYRPEKGSEHCIGAAFDINPLCNPVHTDANGQRKIRPSGARYDPKMKGTITKQSEVWKLLTSLGFEWGGDWGNPQANLSVDSFKEGYFAYQHFQLDTNRHDELQDVRRKVGM